MAVLERCVGGIAHRMFNKAVQHGRSEVRDALNKSRHACECRRESEAAVSCENEAGGLVNILLGMFGHKPTSDREALVVISRLIDAADPMKARHRKHDQRSRFRSDTVRDGQLRLPAL